MTPLSLRELSDAEQREARAMAQIEQSWSEASEAYRRIEDCHRKEKRLWVIAAVLALLGSALILTGVLMGAFSKG